MQTPKGIFIAHADHGLGEDHLRVLDDVLVDWDGKFIIKVVQLPDGVTPLQSALYGPAAGDAPVGEDEVFYRKRGNRPGPSRLIRKPTRPVMSMVIIGGPGHKGDSILYTVYGGQIAAPREWWDTGMKPQEALEAAQFWCEHALSDQG